MQIADVQRSFDGASRLQDDLGKDILNLSDAIVG